MKKLLKVFLCVKRHSLLILGIAVSLLFLTVANKMEVFSIAMLTGGDLSAAQKAGATEIRASISDFIIHLKSFLGLDQGKILPALVFLLSISCFNALFIFLSRYLTSLFSIRVSRDLRLHYFEHIQRLPMSFYKKYNIGSLSSRVVNDTSQIALSLNALVTNYFYTPFLVFSSLVFCFIISPQLSSIIFIGIICGAVPFLWITRKVKKITRQLQKNQEGFSSLLIDFLAGIQTVKIFSMEAFSLKKYREQNKKMGHLESKTAKYDLLTRPILHVIVVVCICFIMICGTYLMQLGFAEIICFCGLIMEMYQPIKKFAEENANIQKGVVASERLLEVLQIVPKEEEEARVLPLKAFTSSIRFEDVWFRYEDQWVLKGVSFTVHKGESVAIVGSTGAGKSTILQLLPRLYDVEKGTIYIDEHPLHLYTRSSLRDKIAFVPQKPFLFIDTIEANIDYGRGCSLSHIEESAKRAYAHEFIQQLPNKYQTSIANMGQNLSGGQQQRLAIARALSKGSPILLLDEATSALDTLSENHIKQAIFQLKHEVTQIIVAHRLSTIEYVDKIIVIDKGMKIAEGTKDELLEQCPKFHQMWNYQFTEHVKR